MPGSLVQWDVGPVVGPPVRVAVGPVGLDQLPVAQVLDADAAGGELVAQPAGLVQLPEQVGQAVDPLLERGAQMRGAQDDGVADEAWSVAVALGSAVTGLGQGAADDQAAHGVPDEHHVLHRDRPAVDEPVEEPVELSFVGGDP